MARRIVFNALTGAFDLIDVATSTGAPATPTSIAAADTFTVAANTQTLVAYPITSAGLIRLDGIMVVL